MMNRTAKQTQDTKRNAQAQWIEVSNKNRASTLMYVLSLSSLFAAFIAVAAMHVNAATFIERVSESPSIFCICTYKWPCWRARGIYNAIP